MAGGQGRARGAEALVASGGLMVTVLLWGAMVPFTALLVARHDAIAVTAGRYVLGLLALIPFVLWREGRRLTRGHVPWRRVFLLGAGMAGFTSLYSVGIKLSDPVTAAVVLSCGPIVASLMARLMYGEMVEKGMSLAIVLAVAGAALVLMGAVRPASEGQGFRGGEILLVVAQLSWTWYSMKAQEWIAPLGWSQVRLSALTSVACMCWLLGAYLVLLPVGLTEPVREWPNQAEWLMLLAIGWGSVAIAVPCWNFGVSRLGVPLASLYVNLTPIVAVGLAALLGLPMSWLQLVGGFMVVSGVVQMQVRRL